MRETFGIERGSFLRPFDSGGARHAGRAFPGERLAFLVCFHPEGSLDPFCFNGPGKSDAREPIIGPAVQYGNYSYGAGGAAFLNAHIHQFSQQQG
jgi:hypothetical protein